jgi:hypothetical protein
MSKASTRSPVALAPGEGRSHDMGRIRAVFNAGGAQTANRCAISEWWLEPNTSGPGPTPIPKTTSSTSSTAPWRSSQG